MGSGVLLAALVVLWFVVLVPMVVTRGDAAPARVGAVDSGRTLRRRRVVDPVVHADTERVAVDREQLYRTGELQVDVHALRRRTLAGLAALAVLALVGALTYRTWLWAPQVLLDLAVVGYLMVTRAAAQRERRAAARRQARVASRPARPAARPAPRPAAAAAPSLPVHSLPLAPVHPLRPGRTVTPSHAAPAAAGWQHSAVVGLDDDDIGFAEIDVYAPRTATG
ncbi:hypothetical protein [Klenkia terrae]|jgi:hypothetical protein|uniref:Integral membrane protein n=1 Tax=Klenkia terrae TaxID=1052259 RepID=A0ABU8E0G3_9ACTN